MPALGIGSRIPSSEGDRQGRCSVRTNRRVREPRRTSAGRPGIGIHQARASMCAACQPLRSRSGEAVVWSACIRRSANDSIGVRPARMSVIRSRHRRGIASSPNRAPSRAPATAPFVSVSPPASIMFAKVRSKPVARQYTVNPISNSAACTHGISVGRVPAGAALTRVVAVPALRRSTQSDAGPVDAVRGTGDGEYRSMVDPIWTLVRRAM